MTSANLHRPAACVRSGLLFTAISQGASDPRDATRACAATAVSDKPDNIVLRIILHLTLIEPRLGRSIDVAFPQRVEREDLLRDYCDGGQRHAPVGHEADNVLLLELVHRSGGVGVLESSLRPWQDLFSQKPRRTMRLNRKTQQMHTYPRVSECPMPQSEVCGSRSPSEAKFPNRSKRAMHDSNAHRHSAARAPEMTNRHQMLHWINFRSMITRQKARSQSEKIGKLRWK